MRFLVGLVMLWLAAALASADQDARKSTDPETGLSEWRWQSQGLSIRLAQLLPDQVRAFFQGRGFDAETADEIARRCVFQSVIRNSGAEGVVRLDLTQWRSWHDDERPLRLNRVWQEEWEGRDVGEAARIAFRWALFPAEHEFRPGDWLMGMLVVDREPGARFDLEVRWAANGQERSGVLRDLRCAPDADRGDAP